ncbi:YggS family pyridoxal phosphate-dependent enzyme [Helicobacter sp. 11S02629-2]|uniref:YggS family pyridoxal phosphate-dependent enzyme n=1 Tax=Helicobacter sp. 11S02629-2 TaxID=1476195 RepID=UPI000BA5132F|nr:YggS family pyridoxal phosphate-dependent enzyme [Helicobacter sp. 11S02629-2]PAF44913.1 YggS family pyridoxal phosphate enzyme [Helicobacter sp. 11S02629-2]
MIKENLKNITLNIEKLAKAYASNHKVELLAVSKYTDMDSIKEAFACGQVRFGENKIQDLRLKALKLPSAKWHMIGHLQTNKINAMLELHSEVGLELFESLDSLKLARLLQKHLESKNETLNCLLQVNSAKEESKSGFLEEELLEAYELITRECKNLNVLGLMCIGAHVSDTSVIEKSFKITKDLFDKIGGLSVLSMGMSSDYELAIANGSSLVRIGSAIFKN